MVPSLHIILLLKWYWPFFIYAIKVSFYNSWILNRKLNNEERLPLLSHIRAITQTVIHQHTKDKHIKKCKNLFHNSRVSSRVTSDVRFDGLNHLLGSDEKKSRCALCGKTTVKKCIKCDVKLHANCFGPFHGQIG